MYKDKMVDPDSSADMSADFALTKLSGTYSGDGTLLIIATENVDKIQLLKDAASRKVTGRIAQVEAIAADSGVGEQPYNHMGRVGAQNRINSAIALSKALKDEDGLRQRNIGTVLVATVESYIRLQGDEGVDFGYILIHDATTGVSDHVISEGVPFPKAYVKIAQEGGFEDSACLQGKVTVGSVMAKRYEKEGMAKADPHKFLCGRSRYDILRDAADRLKQS